MSPDEIQMVSKIILHTGDTAERRGYQLGLEAAAKVAHEWTAYDVEQSIRALKTTPQEG